MEKTCPKCGTSSRESEFAGNFCASCYPVSISIPAELKVEQCKRCQNIKYDGWSRPINANFAKLILQKSKGRFEGSHFSQRNSVFSVQVAAPGGPITKSYFVKLDITPAMCSECAKALGNYSEAIIQLRGDPDKVYKYAGLFRDRITKHTFISKESELKEGIDLYVGNKDEALEAVKHYDFPYLRTEKLVGQKRDGRRIYRSTFRIRF